MEIVSTQKYAHTSPRKLRLIVDMVRRMHPAQAMTMLQFTPKLAAGDLKKIISTAVANARQGGMQVGSLYFKSIEVNEGPVIKRYRPASKGRALPFKRRMAHVKIVLSDEGKGVSVKGKEREIKVEDKIETETKKVEEKKGEAKPKATRAKK